MRKLRRPKETKRMSKDCNHHLWTFWHYTWLMLHAFATPWSYFNIQLVCRFESINQKENREILNKELGAYAKTFTFPMESLINSFQSPLQIDSSPFSKAPCLSTITFSSPHSFSAPCIPLGSFKFHLSWGGGRLWIPRILQNETLPKELSFVSADQLSNLKA